MTTKPFSTGLTAIVGGIVAYLPKEQLEAESGKWHWAFMQLREHHKAELPELKSLEFSRRDGVWPISERLERIFQVIDMAGSGSTLNPNLLVRQFSALQKERLKHALEDSLKEKETILQELGEELQKLLEDAPPTPPAE